MTLATTASLPAGDYTVFAKTTVVQTSTGETGGAALNDTVRCTLNGDPSTNTATDDYAEVELGRGNHEPDSGRTGRVTLQTMVTISLPAPATLDIKCRKNAAGETDVARETKIIAVQVESAPARRSAADGGDGHDGPRRTGPVRNGGGGWC